MDAERKNQANKLARECMVTALMLLLKEKPLSAISISELTEKAGVSRMTYYRNYQSKEDIFSSFLEEALTDYQREAKELSLDQHAYASANLFHCFSYFEKHKEFLDSLFKSGLGHLLLTAISRYVPKRVNILLRMTAYRIKVLAGQTLDYVRKKHHLRPCAIT